MWCETSTRVGSVISRRATGIGPYWGFARVRFADLMANRTRFLIGILSYLIYVSVYYSIYRAVYGTGETIGGLQLPEALSYVAVAWLLRSLYTNNLDRELTEEVRQGDIALSLLRPLDFNLAKLTGVAGEIGFRAFFFTLPTALVVLAVYPVLPPASLGAGLGFVASTLLAVAVYTQINLLVGLTAIFTEHTVGIQRAKNAMIDLFGGVLLPLSFYPAWAQSVLAWLPFQAVAYSPVSIYLGRLAPLKVIAVQLLWTVILYALSRRLWRRAAFHLTVQGG
jgi:ABC-2 type transport system permease protein